MVAGNFIGTNSQNATDLGNKADGVTIFNGATQNTIGGSTAAARNVISGNILDGIGIFASGTSNNVVSGNYIGVNGDATAALGNGQYGVGIASSASSNRIGTDSDGVHDGAEANVIGGNTWSGIAIFGAGSSQNVVAGNFVGTNATSAVALGNKMFGVLVFNGAASNVIGGSATAARNVISGNLSSGVFISDPGTTKNRVQGNYIGTDVAGAAKLANQIGGIAIVGGAANNIVGTDGDGIGDAVEGNVIAGNTADGVAISGSGSDSNVVAGNLIGIGVTGQALGNGGNGVAIFGGATKNRIGTDSNGKSDLLERNIIAASGSHGLVISGAGTASNLVAGNFVGIDATGLVDLGNTSDGILIDNGAANNVIGGLPAGAGNTIAFNKQTGVGLTPTAGSGNTIEHNSLFSNTLLGIDLNYDNVTANDTDDADNGPNKLQNFPVLSAANLIGRSMTVQFAVPRRPPMPAIRSSSSSSRPTPTLRKDKPRSALPAMPRPTREARSPPSSLLPPASPTAKKSWRRPPMRPETPRNSLCQSAPDRAPQPWHNPNNGLDVNGDSHVAPNDALAIINYINAFGGGSVTTDTPPGPPFYDTNDNGSISAGDALAVINAINAGMTGEGESTALSSSASESLTSPTPTVAASAADLLFLLADPSPPARSRAK